MLLDNPVVQQERKPLPMLWSAARQEGKMGKAFQTACRAQSEMKTLYAHIQISVCHQTGFFSY